MADVRWPLLAVWLATMATAAPRLGPVQVSVAGQPAGAPTLESVGTCLVAPAGGPQVAFGRGGIETVIALRRGEQIELSAALEGLDQPVSLVLPVRGGPGRLTLSVGGQTVAATLPVEALPQLDLAAAPAPVKVTVTFAAPDNDATVRLGAWVVGGDRLPWRPAPAPAGVPPSMVEPRPAVIEALVEWDWQLQDGIDTPQGPRTWAQATELTLTRGAALAAELGRPTAPWDALRARTAGLAPGSPVWPELWRQSHQLKRELALTRLDGLGPLAFVKQVPSMFSHQLTQYYGSCARPGGGLFVLNQPGRTWQTRQLAADLPLGSTQHLDVSWDGRQILFAFCPTNSTPRDRESNLDRCYHLYRIAADGSGLQQLTRGAYDDFSPRWLPDGQIVFISSRRGGFHRCGRGPCAVYTLALLGTDGAAPRVISFHETNEWDPAVLRDGRVAYTRWDYVDRNAVHYQQLWTTRPDGTGVSILYGNNTLNPVGVWEARAVPGSDRIMATAAAHHAMTAGSIVLVDPRQGVDGPAPLTRLTPDVPFPEGETRVSNGQGGGWGPNAPPPSLPPDARRWPGSTYRSPWPLSERCFLAAYSYDPLIGEPNGNPPNQYGLYLVDAAGNKELIYRDLNLSSLWPMPLAPRAVPPVLPSHRDERLAAERAGTFLLQDVRRSWPALPDVAIRSLRIVQVLPKTTPHANDPPVGLANASPGKQVLGTVPVEADGSAYFRAPASLPLAFQALDEQGRAVQNMRSLVYLQPGETATCIGCHEPRTTAPGATRTLAGRRAPSVIKPGPDGSRPLSFQRLVQPVLDAKCVSCHRGPEAKGGVRLTAEPHGAFSVAYNTLAPLVPFSAWGRPQGNFEPLAPPDTFGARASAFARRLLAGHHGVELTAADRERLFTWMDANALFYGTFDRADQARQRRGEVIAGPALE